jgi:hypothetical protein
MFPLDIPEASTASAAPVSPSNTHIPLQPKIGRHTEKYTSYRTTSLPPPVLRRMTQRGASVIGVEEEALRYSIRWLESKLNTWRSNITRSARSSDMT